MFCRPFLQSWMSRDNSCSALSRSVRPRSPWQKMCRRPAAGATAAATGQTWRMRELSVRDQGGMSLSAFVLLFCFTCFTQCPVVAFTSESLDFHWPGSRIVAIGDLHGDLGNTVLLLYGAGVVDENGDWIGGDTLLVQTGDIVDRGPDGKRIYDYFARLSSQARERGGKVVQLLGNHDVMNICGDFRYAHPSETKEFGGPSGRRRQFMDDGSYGRLLRSYPAAVKVDGVVFSHAGIPKEFADMGLLKLTNQLHEELADDCKLHNTRFYNEVTALSPSSDLFVAGSHGPLWTRVFSMGETSRICEELDNTLAALGAGKMVIGHTVQESGNIEAYCDGRLLLIDTGISRYVANSPRMLEIHDGAFYEWKADVAEQGSGEPRVRASKRRLNVPALREQPDADSPPQRGDDDTARAQTPPPEGARSDEL
ncbi:Ser/Thr phosphatase family protein [Besnoitia besnoiti]|uniref:Ser/Thr phosphatase family protein n=1 Tax=Besnoitia besnoiti TaxID=94643 RepID=A0A2A9M5Y1_BESBE|nr:Ser/Thr phosphatase family protein [Besnoitia besnoiti]PFH32604.1 Ser/Thr phosphatase family protein [Besnoitia besnoiti]